MKESMMTVTMPLIAYKEFESYRKRYYELMDKVKLCFTKSDEALVDYKLQCKKVIELGKEVGVLTSDSNIDIAL